MASPDKKTDKTWRKGFWSLFFTQSQGAFSDNVFKFVVIYTAMSLYPVENDQDKLVTIIGALFAIPFILFTMTGGYCADKFSKRNVTVGIKIAEIVIMSLGALALYFQSLPALFAVIFLMSTQSAFFGPVKYGLLPEMLPEKRLSWGNGIEGFGTFIAIIFGTVAGGLLFESMDQRWHIGLILITCSISGFFISRGISKVPPADPDKTFRVNFFGEFWTQLKYAKTDRPLILAIWGNTFFWFMGALVQQAVMIYGKNELQLTFFQTSVLFAMMAVGIGLGSVVAGYVSARKIEYGLIPLGSMGMVVFSFLMGQPGLSANTFGLFLGLLGFSGGFFIVPISALVQHRPSKERKGSVIAMQNFLAWWGIMFSAVLYLGLKSMGLSTNEVFIVIGGLTILSTTYIIWLLPDALLRLVLFLLTNTIYRIKVKGRDNIPEKDGALFACNHLSFVDALLIVASTDRQIRFLMSQEMYDIWWLKPIVKAGKVIPIHSSQNPRKIVNALRTATNAIKAGDIICIFPEGKISKSGKIQQFRAGFERIMKNLDNPIIPIHLDGVWGSIFSYHKGRTFTKFPKKIPYPVTVTYGEHLPPNSTPDEVRDAVIALSNVE